MHTHGTRRCGCFADSWWFSVCEQYDDSEWVCASFCDCKFSLTTFFSLFLLFLPLNHQPRPHPLTLDQEGGRSKSHRYWPKLGSKHNSATHGKFKVTTKFRTDSGCYATTGLKVKHLLSGQERTIWHLQYTDWPEQGCPEYVQGFLCEWDCAVCSLLRYNYSINRVRQEDRYHSDVCVVKVKLESVIDVSEDDHNRCNSAVCSFQ